jgi:hypothetical protein
VKLFLPPTLALLVRTVKSPSLYYEVSFDREEDAFVLPWYRTLEKQEGRTTNSSQHAREGTHPAKFAYIATTTRVAEDLQMYVYIPSHLKVHSTDKGWRDSYEAVAP